jgi:hypothetical protein
MTNNFLATHHDKTAQLGGLISRCVFDYKKLPFF